MRDRGITPVIAIIILLLITVAAAGAFYFFYQNFRKSGESSGSTQIEQVGSEANKAVKVESISSGKIYVKNTGVGNVDTGLITVYVDGVPVDTESSTDTIGEGERGYVQLTNIPACDEQGCLITISGAGPEQSLNVPRGQLVCGATTCTPAETCLDEVCVPGKDEFLLTLSKNHKALRIKYKNKVKGYEVEEVYDWVDINTNTNGIIDDFDGDTKKEVMVGVAVFVP